jgi:hypothetical protein
MTGGTFSLSFFASSTSLISFKRFESAFSSGIGGASHFFPSSSALIALMSSPTPVASRRACEVEKETMVESEYMETCQNVRGSCSLTRAARFLGREGGVRAETLGKGRRYPVEEEGDGESTKGLGVSGVEETVKVRVLYSSGRGPRGARMAWVLSCF